MRRNGDCLEAANSDQGGSDTVTAWRFLRRHWARIVIGAMCAAAMYAAISVWVWRQSYARERRFMEKCESRGGRCTFRFVGPSWVPMWLEGRLHFCYRIDYVVAGPRNLPADFMPDLQSLTAVAALDLGETDLTDSEMVHLETLVRLRTLRLDRTRLTDAGLRHLPALTQLQTIDLFATQTTPEGRESLRKALPNCRITPDP